MLAQNYTPDWNVVLQRLGITAKNTWFYTKTLAGCTLGQGARLLEEAGHVVSGLYADAIKKYMDMTAERARGIVVAREDGDGLIVQAVYTMPSTASSFSSLQASWWSILPAAAHVFGLDPKPSSNADKYDQVLASGIGDVPVVSRSVGGLKDVEVIEDYTEADDEDKKDEKEEDGYDGYGKRSEPGQLKPGSRLLDSDDDGSFLIIVLDKGHEKEQIKEIERSISECRNNVTERKKSDVAMDNAKTIKERSPSPLRPGQMPRPVQQDSAEHQGQEQRQGSAQIQSIMNGVPLFREERAESCEESIRIEFGEDDEY